MTLMLVTALGDWDDRIQNIELPNPGREPNRYAVMMPEKVEDGKRYPLVLALHYGGRVTPFFGRGYLELLVAPAFARQDWIIVAPDCPGRGWASPEARDFIPKLLDHLKARYPLDDRKVLVGYSMGAAGAWFWAEQQPGEWRAVVAVSGRAPDGDPEKLKQTPFYVIHSREDELIPFSRTMTAINALKKQGVSAKFVPLKDLKHYETGAFVPSLKRTTSWLKKQLK
ncbi:MAG: alpha/beta fold hydrolase [Acidobacteriota bacterium]|nr:alpha/beta fold hydrolase [Acidobacteriota bacterium]